MRYLHSLGFRLPIMRPNVGCAAILSDKGESDGTGPSDRSYPHDPPYNRRIVEFCCGRNSRLGRPYPWNSGCETVRITLDNDVTTPKGLSFALKAIKDTHLKILLWISIPCTGGCSWKHVNKKRGKATRRLIAKRIRDFRLIWSACLKVLEASRRGCVICLEWPRSCDYWKRREVKRTLRKH